MQDMSRITGDPVILKPKSKGGREFIVRGACFEDVGLLQAEILKKKRKAKADAAGLMLEYLTPHERQVTLEKVRKEIAEIAYVSMKETMEFVLSEEGTITFLWCLLENQ
jgi:hypothetical protein